MHHPMLQLNSRRFIFLALQGLFLLRSTLLLFLEQRVGATQVGVPAQLLRIVGRSGWMGLHCCQRITAAGSALGACMLLCWLFANGM